MADFIEVNISNLEQDCRYIEEHIARIKKEIEKMYIIVADLNGMWDSAAEKIFVSQLIRSRANLEELLEEAEKMAAKISFAIETYKTCEGNVSGEIDEINI